MMIMSNSQYLFRTMELVIKDFIKTKKEYLKTTTFVIEHLTAQWVKANAAFESRFDDEKSWNNRQQNENVMTHLNNKICDLTLKRQKCAEELAADENLLEAILTATEKAKEEAEIGRAHV